jgi:hypothetical protein
MHMNWFLGILDCVMITHEVFKKLLARHRTPQRIVIAATRVDALPPRKNDQVQHLTAFRQIKHSG